MPVPQQLPHIAVLPAWHPDPRKTIFYQQLQNVPCILAVGLLLPYPLRSDFGGIGMTINEVLPLMHAPINASAVVDCNKVYCAPDSFRLWQHVDGTFTLSGYWLTERVSGNLTPSQDHQQMMGGKPEEVLENFTESQTAELMRQKISAGYEWRWEYTFVNGMLTSSFTVTFGRDGRVNDISDVHVTNLQNHRA